MVMLPEIKEISDLQASFPQDIIAEKGIEDELHVTCKFGLHTADPAEVSRIVSGFGPVELGLGRTMIFPAPEHEVLVCEVESDGLHELNRLITTSTPCTDTFPVYHPHMTIAYLTLGNGAKYAGVNVAEGRRYRAQSVVFSSKDGTKHVISLVG